jgi:hypothetical protein
MKRGMRPYSAGRMQVQEQCWWILSWVAEICAVRPLERMMPVEYLIR